MVSGVTAVKQIWNQSSKLLRSFNEFTMGHNLRLQSEPLEAEAYFFHLVYHLFLTRKKEPHGVPTIFVGTVVPTNLSEQPMGNKFSVPTILVGTPRGSFFLVRKR